MLCEPVRFEILRSAFRRERKYIEETFATVSLISSPTNLWEKSILLGQKCLDSGAKVPPIDLLIAQICITKISPLEVWLLSRAL